MFSGKYGKVSFSSLIFLGLNLLMFWETIATFFHITKLKKSMDPKIPPKKNDLEGLFCLFPVFLKLHNLAVFMKVLILHYLLQQKKALLILFCWGVCTLTCILH